MKRNEFLKSLGKTPEEVARYCSRNGYVGERLNPRSCIIAHVLQDKGLVWPSTMIFNRDNGKGERDYFLYVDDIQIMSSEETLPEPVNTFIRKFDEGEYPDLIGKMEKRLVKSN